MLAIRSTGKINQYLEHSYYTSIEKIQDPMEEEGEDFVEWDFVEENIFKRCSTL